MLVKNINDKISKKQKQIEKAETTEEKQKNLQKAEKVAASFKFKI